MVLVRGLLYSKARVKRGRPPACLPALPRPRTLITGQIMSCRPPPAQPTLATPPGCRLAGLLPPCGLHSLSSHPARPRGRLHPLLVRAPAGRRARLVMGPPQRTPPEPGAPGRSWGGAGQEGWGLGRRPCHAVHPCPSLPGRGKYTGGVSSRAGATHPVLSVRPPAQGPQRPSMTCTRLQCSIQVPNLSHSEQGGPLMCAPLLGTAGRDAQQALF